MGRGALGFSGGLLGGVALGDGQWKLTGVFVQAEGGKVKNYGGVTSILLQHHCSSGDKSAAKKRSQNPHFLPCTRTVQSTVRRRGLSLPARMYNEYLGRWVHRQLDRDESTVANRIALVSSGLGGDGEREGK